jgi:phospholipase C
MTCGPHSNLRIVLLALTLIVGFLLGLSGCVGITHTGPVTQPVPDQLTVNLAGGGTGTVSSAPAGINCGTTCSATFTNGTSVTLTAAPGPGVTFAGWGGACSGTTLTCSVAVNATTSVTATFNPPSLQSINHIIFLAQENRAFDHYFGALREYWAQNGIPDQAYDGLPQFNIPAGAAPSNPGCDPTQPPPADCKFDPTHQITSYHLTTQCIENPSPSWNESHVDWSFNDPSASKSTTAALDGFVWTAAHDARNQTPIPYNDVDGVRAMGYYDGTDLNFYYFMASKFATSDAWFSPVMSRTDPNRMYLIAATSQGHVYPLAQTQSPPLTATTIFQELQAAGITWKIYVNPAGTQPPCSDTDSACLLTHTTIENFTYRSTIPLQNVVSIKQYFADAANGTLPQVALIEPAFSAGLDEHPTVQDQFPSRIQAGAKYVQSLITAIMGTPQNPSPSWKDTAFILTFDEGGGLYDHVAPQTGPTEVSPDGIKPSDLSTNPPDVCVVVPGATCDFTYSGYRVPMIVISPFAKKNFVSHTLMDYTAILKLIETRFGVPALTKRDAAQPDMGTEFFDFTNPQWITPPSPPAQNTNDACTLTPPAPG